MSGATQSRKRKASSSESRSPSPRAFRPWPTTSTALAAARTFIQTLPTRTDSSRILLLPDKDADGLCGGMIIYKTLILLGIPAESITVHFVAKGSNIHREDERVKLQQINPDVCIVIDQGSRSAPPVIHPTTPTLIIDHHASTAFPADATICSAYGHDPIATSSLLSFIVCEPLHPDVRKTLAWLAVVGTVGDLGASVKWKDPFPDLSDVVGNVRGKHVTEAVALLNAPRRTATSDPTPAWRALQASTSASDISQGKVTDVPHLRDCRSQVASEIQRCARAPPRFSDDGRVALITISTPYQIHPIIASRWSNTLKGKSLHIVMVANTGYLPHRTNFAIRVAQRGGGTIANGAMDIMRFLEECVAKVPGLREECGDEFAKGHAGASGGSVREEVFGRVVEAMGFVSGGARGKTKSNERKAQDRDVVGTGKGTLESFGFTKVAKK
ncbi:hypothetical protein HK104_007742 [Borealophlyctis nickersoniae]|nr:hypothetical protein HK104_007742 [Borealophlyctis nickersoniae]